MKIRLLILASIVFLMGLLITFQREQMESRSLHLKLGPAPNPQILELTAGRFKPLIASWWVSKVLFYYGSFNNFGDRKSQKVPEYYGMYKTLQAAVLLDPYNIDAYYFSQAIFTWNLNRVKEVNALLEHGMKYRDWDYQLPFYAGFNAAYFLHDYAEGARLMKIAADRSGSTLPVKLAARYFYQAHETELGIIFLQAVLEQVSDRQVREIYSTRLSALHAVREIELAMDAYTHRCGIRPNHLEDLLEKGFLDRVPVDPYGGRFYLGKDGAVSSTSNFAFVETTENTN